MEIKRQMLDVGRPVHFLLLTLLLTLFPLALGACGSPEPAGRVFFVEPQPGATVKSPFKVRMGTEGLVIEPAKEGSEYPHGHGHHHIIVDAPFPGFKQPIPDNVQHLHFGQGQVETMLDLEPGNHTLRLLFAKGDHVPWDPAITDTIELTVVD